MVVNKTEALSRLDNDAELYEEIVAVFLEDTPIQIKKLKEAIGGGDDASALRLAHSLKSASGNIGANIVREWALKMAAAARTGGAAGAAPFLAPLEEAYQAVEQYFGTGG